MDPGQADQIPVGVHAQVLNETNRLQNLVQHLRRQLILSNVKNQILRYFKNQVLKFFPTFRIGGLPALEMKQILDHRLKFQKAGGLLKDFAKAVEISPATLANWQNSTKNMA